MKKQIVMLAALGTTAAAAVVACVIGKKMHQKAGATTYVTPKDSYEEAELPEVAEQVNIDYYAAVRNAYDGGPNANPVYSEKIETPLTPDGKIDVTKLASPEDFYNWEEHGCQS